MRLTVDVLTDILFPVVEQARQTFASGTGLSPQAQSPLFGDGGLDSLGLVRFVVMVEERLEDLTGASVTLASDRALSRKASPFRTLQTLADYISECLADEVLPG